MRIVPKRCEIVSEGHDADAWYIIISGRAEIEVSITAGGDGHQVATLADGDTFGEFGLIYDHPRFATVRSLDEEAVLAEMGRDDYLRILRAAHTARYFADLERKLAFLARMRHFAAWPRHALIALSYLLRAQRPAPGAAVYFPRDGSFPSLCFLAAGACTVWSHLPPAAAAAADAAAGGYLLEVVEPGYFFGASCTAASVERIMAGGAGEGEPVELLVADHIEVQLGRFGPLLAQSLTAHRADEQIVLDDRAAHLLAIQRDLRRAAADAATAAAVTAAASPGGGSGSTTFRQLPAVPAARAARVAGFPTQTTIGRRTAPPQDPASPPPPAGRPSPSGATSPPRRLGLSPAGGDTHAFRVSPASPPSGAAVAAVAAAAAAAAGRGRSGGQWEEVVLVFDRCVRALVAAAPRAPGGGMARRGSLAQADGLRVALAHALLLPQICVRVGRARPLGGRAAVTVSLSSPDDAAPRRARDSAAALVAQAADPNGAIRGGGGAGAWLSAALYVDSETGALIGASRAAGGRVESCIHNEESVEGWYLSQVES